MAENKIPVLTEIYQPKKEQKSGARKENSALEITPELVERISAEVRLQLEREIKGALQKKLRSEIEAELKDNLQKETAHLRETILSEANAIVDAAKHDLSADKHELAQANASSLSEVREFFDQSKNQIDSAIADMVANKNAMEQAKMSAIQEAHDFLDKAKADLKTELPLMYQQTIDLAQVNLSEKFAILEKETQKKFSEMLNGSVLTISSSAILQFTSQLDSLHLEKSESISKQLEKDIQAFQKRALAENETLVKTHAELTESLSNLFLASGQSAEKEFAAKFQEFHTSMLAEQQQKLNLEADQLIQGISKRLEDSAQEQLGLIDTQVGAMQQDGLAQLRERFNAEKTEIYNTVSAEIKTTFAEQMSAKGEEIKQNLMKQIGGELPAVQEVLRRNIQQLVTQSMTNFETKMRSELRAEISALLQKVRFVLPE